MKSATVLLLSEVAILTSLAGHTPDPSTVTVAGDLQSELGCPGDWQPDCAVTHLTYDAEDDLWQGVFSVPAGSWEYKAALNDSWDENYGAGGVQNGPNIPLNLSAGTDVKFYYDHKTHWITDNVNSVIATAPGSFQSELGCSGDWQPWCLRSWLQDPDFDEIFTLTTSRLPAGDYEVKVAHDESWAENYGAGGIQNGPNIPFNVASDCQATEFSYELSSHILTVSPAPAPPQPAVVTIPGDFQGELGCPGDWQPDCAVTHLGYDAEDDQWQGTFTIPAGNWEYKASLNDSWDVNFGENATQDGPNILLFLGAATDVKFYYDHETNWVWDNQNKVIATLAGNFQSELGCSGDWQPWCLRSQLLDPDGDGIYTLSTGQLPAGNYEVKVAHDEDWVENYGAGGVQNGPNIPFTVPESCAEIFFTYDPVTHLLTIGTGPGGPVGNLNLAQAHWVTEDTFAWNPGSLPTDATFALHYAAAGGLGLDEDGVTGADGSLVLAWDPAGLPTEVTDKFPHLSAYKAFKLDAADLVMVPMILKGQFAVSAAAGDGTPVDATSVQIPGVLDDLYAYSGDLGVVFNSYVPTFKLWAPTARMVTLMVYDDPMAAGTPYPMTADPASGVWSVTGAADWYGKFYRYEVEVFVLSTGDVESNLVTDPYSVSLAADSSFSQIVKLSDPSFMPSGWGSLEKPALEAPEDIVIYELHVRDFSIWDKSVPEMLRGTFGALAVDGSDGMNHLRQLAEAGLTHVHILPSFDIATIPERREDQLSVDEVLLASYPPDSAEQQAAIAAIADQDGFNWGYDPWHYTTPEGSYATDPDGPARILEFREMVQGLNQAALRVVMDVVYNHTNAAGQNAKSVLDRIVPGYYHRLNADGAIETSSCCPNTASEHNMMEKLMIDSLVTWARDYKVDGFRFDLMGHHPKSTMLKIRQAMDSLNLAEHGVDGTEIYLYGEGWNFGEVANNARFVQATQANMAGTGIGTFSDRLRDGVRGGNPFSDVREQGFINGLGYDSSDYENNQGSDQVAELRHISDWIRIGLAGDLADFMFVDADGNTVRADQVDYFGQQAGYTADPQENIKYVAAHDNETLFDTTQLKAPQPTSMADRVRIQNVANSIVALGQGIPFFHAGQDILRSKSMDRDSYNSGDWFNAVDWTYQTTNWGHGLPTAEKNQDKWPIMAPLLADPGLAPQPSDVMANAAYFREMLEIRKSSPLFRLQTAGEVKARVGFHNTGPGQIPGLIVMSIVDDEGGIDRCIEQIDVLFNARNEDITFEQSALAGATFQLHPVQTTSVDPVVGLSSFDSDTGTFTVPGRITAVFVAARSVTEKLDLLMADVYGLYDDGVLNEGQANSLVTKLTRAGDAYARGSVGAAENQVAAFQNQVQDFVVTGILTAESGAFLIGNASNVFTCGPFVP
jgi:pullulanase-type alpha-1,6-glucosidase